MRRRRDEGVVLVLVLVILVLTIASAYAFARVALLDVEGLRQRGDRARAEMLARSGFGIALRALRDDAASSQTGETLRDAWALLGAQPYELEAGGEIRMRVRDSGSRVNLNGLVDEDGTAHPESPAFLRALLERAIEGMPGRREEKPYEAEELANAILDWIDDDDLTRLGDGEIEWYAARGGGAPPANRPLLSVGELDSVPGIDGRLIEELDHYLTFLPLTAAPADAGVNPNTAPPHVLAAIWHGTSDDRRPLAADDVFRVLRTRGEGRMFCGSTENPDCVTFAEEVGRVGETVFPPLRYASDVFTIESEGRFGEARVRIEAVVDRSGASGGILWYRMD
jgi:type II secretory pathway component PulK